MSNNNPIQYEICKGWGYFIHPSKAHAHVIPHQDTGKHSIDLDCECGPEIDDDQPNCVYMHNSYDGRELYEKGERLPH